MKRLIIYKSSAGSGKTYTLVKEYLLIALKHPMQFRQILAITFTNKATAEMKGRIIKALGDLAAGIESTLSKELNELLALTECTLQERATEVLTALLHHYSDFSVSTIDSFFNDMVKALAHELKLSLKFEIEIDQDLIINKACEELLNKVGTDNELRRYLEQFIEYKMEYDKGWRIKNELNKIAEHLFDNNSTLITKNNDDKEDIVFSGIIKQLRGICTSYEKTMSGFGNKFLEIIQKHGYSFENFAYKNSGIAGYFQRISNAQKPEDYKPKRRVLDVFEDDSKWTSGENSKNPSLISLIKSKLHPLLIELISYYDANFLLYNSSHESLRLIYVSAILSKINKEIIQYRSENNVITLPDANRLILSSVEASDTPMVFEKTGNFYSYYLLDEFQDTSTIQWENIKPLINEALSNNKSALIVGDVKQSIYRWRGGNMDLLHNGVQKDMMAFKEMISIKQLAINYRSSKQVIEFNNAFFIHAPNIIDSYRGSTLPLIDEAYSKEQLHQQLPKVIDNNGYVKINFQDKANKEDEHWKDRALKQMLTQINELLSLHYNYGDIAILVRNNNDGNIIANFLYENGIHQIISNESLLLSKAPQVTFIINCLRLITEPANDILNKEVEWFLFDQQPAKGDLHQFFDTGSSAANSIAVLTGFRKMLKEMSTLSVEEAATLIISHFGLNKIPDAYIQRLQDIIIEYLSKNLSDIDSFIRWWDDITARKSFSVIMPSTNDAIQIITIHKSKGLQFKIVMIPFTDWRLKPKSGGMLWAPRSAESPFDELEEWPIQSSKALEETVFKESYLKSVEENYIDNLNLLYVAFTRACQQLYITVLRKKESKEKSNSDLIIDTLKTFNAVNEETEKLTIGILNPNTTSSKGKEKQGIFTPDTVFLDAFPINSWQHKLSLKTEKPFTSDSIETGLIVHETLSLIYEEKDLPNAIQKIKGKYHLSKEETDVLKTEINAIFDLCRNRQWFNGSFDSVNETQFCDLNGAIHRPDRVLIKKKKAVIIDYKTGDENDSYRRQTLAYKTLLKECGYSDAECWLVYSTLKKLVLVED